MAKAKEPVISPFEKICHLAAAFGLSLSSEELADLATRYDFGEEGLDAIDHVFEYLAKRHADTVIETLMKLSRIPQKEPKTFDNFDFGRIQGRDASALRKLPALAELHARKNIAFIGPGGIGKTHLAQAYGRECCKNGYKAYYLKATELKNKLKKAAKASTTSRCVATLVRPSCLIIDEVGRCKFDRDCTDIFFDIIDRRYEKEGPNTLIITSNTPVVNWDEFFTGDDTLMCALDRIFDKASVFMMKGASFRGKDCETYAVESVPQAMKLRR